jgi:2,6-dihydroxypseudooxynicotine hydrolase
VDEARIAVWGVSLGGYYAPRWRLRSAAGSGLRGPCRALTTSERAGSSLPELTRRTFQVRSGAQDDAEAHRIREHAEPGGSCRGITAPLLVVFGRKDRLIPWQHAERLVREARGEVEMLMLEEGNHGCANVAPWHRPYTADWVASRLHADL